MMRKISKAAVGVVAITALLANINAMPVGHFRNGDDNDSVKTNGAKTDTLTEAPHEESVIDEVIWVVGDEPILLSDVEAMRMQGEMEGMRWQGDPDCSIPEQIAVQKLFLHQAEIDSIEVSEAEVSQGVERQIN